ncbi:hypothetical protein Cni_G19813 [Canna indica]|uniref:RNase H type-1 domain-containing protein n=1 Tax=Canna indica TaxID=4628 RepID=A0AAQ3KLA1_9LILI|nr:hypothetical protein Cni_G19813 [Canna indica]
MVVNNKDFTLLTTKQSFKISHLLFADDILLMLKANDKSLNAIKNIFEHYQSLIGQSVNPLKYAIYFSNNTPSHIKLYIYQKLGMPEGSFPFKYLGTKISPNYPPPNAYDYLLKSINTRLGSWQSNYLSQTGKLTLINSVLTSISLHTIFVSWLPKKTMNKINSIISNFFWGSTTEHKKLHFISWDQITTPKTNGGLGVHNTYLQSLSLNAKRVAAYLNNKDNMWLQLVKHKYPLLTAMGIIVRNHTGNAIYAECLLVNAKSALHAETLAIRQALLVVMQERYHHAIIESDSKTLVESLKQKSCPDWRVQADFDDISSFLLACNNVCFNFVFKQSMVGMLADPKEARASIGEIHFLLFNPVDKRTALTYIDANGNWHRAVADATYATRSASDIFLTTSGKYGVKEHGKRTRRSYYELAVETLSARWRHSRLPASDEERR